MLYSCSASRLEGDPAPHQHTPIRSRSLPYTYKDRAVPSTNTWSRTPLLRRSHCRSAPHPTSTTTCSTWCRHISTASLLHCFTSMPSADGLKRRTYPPQFQCTLPSSSCRFDISSPSRCSPHHTIAVIARSTTRTPTQSRASSWKGASNLLWQKSHVAMPLEGIVVVSQRVIF